MNTQDLTDVSVNKMKTTVHIPKGGLPLWHLPIEPDTRVHAVLRGVAFTVVGILYLVLVVLHFLQVIHISMHGMTLLATLLILSIPAIQYLIRPGKGITWLLTILLMPLFFLLPITIFLAIVILPVALLIAQACRTYRNRPVPKASGVDCQQAP